MFQGNCNVAGKLLKAIVCHINVPLHYRVLYTLKTDFVRYKILKKGALISSSSQHFWNFRARFNQFILFSYFLVFMFCCIRKRKSSGTQILLLHCHILFVFNYCAYWNSSNKTFMLTFSFLSDEISITNAFFSFTGT